MMRLPVLLLAIILFLLFATVGTYRILQPLTTVDGVLDDIRIEREKRGRYPWKRLFITLRQDSTKYWAGATSDESLKLANPGDLVTIKFVEGDNRTINGRVRALALVINGREIKNEKTERLKEFALLVVTPTIFLILIVVKLLGSRTRVA